MKSCLKALRDIEFLSDCILHSFFSFIDEIKLYGAENFCLTGSCSLSFQSADALRRGGMVNFYLTGSHALSHFSAEMR